MTKRIFYKLGPRPRSGRVIQSAWDALDCAYSDMEFDDGDAIAAIRKYRNTTYAKATILFGMLVDNEHVAEAGGY